MVKKPQVGLCHVIQGEWSRRMLRDDGWDIRIAGAEGHIWAWRGIHPDAACDDMLEELGRYLLDRIDDDRWPGGQGVMTRTVRRFDGGRVGATRQLPGRGRRPVRA